MRIKITADSTCDLIQELIEKYDITLMPLTIIKDGQNYLDNVTITPADIYAHVASGGALCSTAAGNIGDYQQLFSEYAAQYDGLIHISLGSGFSSSYQNACLAAEDYPNVRVWILRTSPPARVWWLWKPAGCAMNVMIWMSSKASWMLLLKRWKQASCWIVWNTWSRVDAAPPPLLWVPIF